MAPTCQALQATSWPLAGPCWRPGPCRRPPGQWQLGPHSGWGRGEWQATWEHLERTDGALGGPEVRGDEPQIWGRGRQEGGGAVGRAGGVPGVLVPGLGVGRGPSSESGKGGVTGAHARGTADAEDTDSSEAAGRRGRCQEGWGPGAPEGGGPGEDRSPREVTEATPGWGLRAGRMQALPRPSQRPVLPVGEPGHPHPCPGIGASSCPGGSILALKEAGPEGGVGAQEGRG